MASPSQQSPRPSCMATGHVLRFLVVSACERSAATLVNYCAAFEIVTDVFASAEAAIETLQRSTTHYELLVIDTDGMGGIGGYALCSWFRDNVHALPGWQPPHALPHATATPRSEIVVLSAAPDPEACAAFGADRCLSKPLSPQCFARAVRGWLAGRQQSH